MDLDLIRLISAGIFVCIGTLGNSLSVITVSNKHCKRSSYTVYLAALAIADTLILYTVALIYSGIGLTVTSLLYCKLHLFLLGLFSSVSIWLIVILALERAFVVYYPFKAKSVCKPKNAFITTALLVVFFIAYNSHFIYGMQMQSGGSQIGDSHEPSLDTNAYINSGKNENTSLPSLKETVFGSINNDDNSSTIDKIHGLFSRKEITATESIVTDQKRDITDHPLAIGCNSMKTKSGNHSLSAPDCRQFMNQTTFNKNGDCKPSGWNSSQLGDQKLATVCNSTKLKSVGQQSKSLPSNECNSSGLRDNNTMTLLPIVFKDNCTLNNRIGDDSPAENLILNSTIMATKRDEGNDSLMITTFCGFIDQSYREFYRHWTMLENISYFWLPLLIIVTANTATWIKVYRSSRGNLTSMAAMTLRRTRHVLILTSLISVGFIIFVSPITILLLVEAFLVDDFKYPLYNEKYRAVLQLIAESLYLCNHSLNFFLYILSGKRFRNSLKAAFCKPASSR